MRAFLDQGLYPLVSRWLKITTENGAVALYLGFFALCIVVPYLLGSINTAVVLSRTIWKDDVRRHGSGNGGMTNMLRTYGPIAAILTFLGDIIKTALSILFAFSMLGAGWVGAGFAMNFIPHVAALFCVLGHIFPIYHRFRGGKGVLCAATAIAILAPWVFFILLLIFICTVAVSKYVSLGSIVAAVTYPLFYNVLVRALFTSTPPAIVVLCVFLLMGTLVFMHRSNIKRIWNGEENRLTFRREKDPIEAIGEFYDAVETADEEITK